jgi:hypothetical protein
MKVAALGLRGTRQLRAAHSDGARKRGRISVNVQTTLAVHMSSCVCG